MWRDKDGKLQPEEPHRLTTKDLSGFYFEGRVEESVKRQSIQAGKSLYLIFKFLQT